jgi:hypothetical protein
MPESRPELSDVANLDFPQLLTRYGRGVENFDRRVLSLTDSQLDTAFLPTAGIGRWPVRVLLGHLADAQLVFVARIRRAVGEERPVLSLWDENAFVDAGMYRGPVAESQSNPLRSPPSVGGFIAVVHTLRKWASEWLTALEPALWERAALHPERGPQSVRDIVVYDCWHLENHAWYLNRKVEHFLGPRAD